MWCVVNKNALNKEMIAQDFLAIARTRIARTYNLHASKGDCEFRARNTLRVRACYFFLFARATRARDHCIVCKQNTFFTCTHLLYFLYLERQENVSIKQVLNMRNQY